jgi:NADH-quinone oxidoreductase subunit C
MDVTERLIDDLRNLPAVVERADYRLQGYHLEVRLQSAQVRDFAKLLRERNFYLAFVSAVHVAAAIEIIYQLACFTQPCRILAKAPVSDQGSVPSIADIFDGANWHERETHEMFGVVFSGHPYLEPLLLPEESADFRPLLKAEDAILPADRIRRQAPGKTEESTPPTISEENTGKPDPEKIE